jgi:predicted transcriptional regulator
MYACNLSWNSIKDTLAQLVAEGCVDEIIENQKKKSYCITAKGRNVIGYYAGLQKLIKVQV